MAATSPWSPRSTERGVSILVLVDWRWRQVVDLAPDLIRLGFNPCSGGLEMAAEASGVAEDQGSWVSILVLVDWRWRPHGRV